MPSIQIKELENVDSALRRFRRMCDRAGIISESRRRRHRETPAQMRKRKRTALHMRLKNRFGGNRRRDGANIGVLLRRANIEIKPKDKESS